MHSIEKEEKMVETLSNGRSVQICDNQRTQKFLEKIHLLRREHVILTKMGA